MKQLLSVLRLGLVLGVLSLAMAPPMVPAQSTDSLPSSTSAQPPLPSAAAAAPPTGTPSVVPAPATVSVPTCIEPLPGGLNKTLVLNSNSPEVVQSEGILVSSLPPAGKSTPKAHLNVLFEGNFDVFLHHIARSDNNDLTTLYVAILLNNPGKHDATVAVVEAAHYLSQPDAPFLPTPDFTENPESRIFAGPGDRVTNDILRHELQSGWPHHLTVPAGQTAVLSSFPIPIKGLMIPLNGRSLLAKLHTDHPLHAATLAMYAKRNEDGAERPPSDDEWRNLLVSGDLAGPREKPPSVPGAAAAFSYGRVAGISQGTQWTGRAVDISHFLAAPAQGQSKSYPISTVVGGTFGTNQVQAAPLIAREPGTAYAAHGNYGVRYYIQFPLINNTDQPRNVALYLETPLKNDRDRTALSFYQQPSTKVWYRGTIELEYEDDGGESQRRYIHLVEHQGQQGQPLLRLCLKPGQKSNLVLQLVYPPDATPPQMVTLAGL